jgi:two-component system NarL family sensor kinase
MRTAEPTALRRDAGGRMESDLRHLADCLLDMLESDRARVSGGLGGEIVSVMTMARYLIEDAAHRLARGELEETTEALQNASTRIRDTTRQLLALCSELRPKVLDDLGLLPALAGYFRDFSQENRAVFVSPRITVAESDIPTGLRLAIFRVVQAALSNVARHSKASAVRVFLSMFEDELRLGIEDNGVGFDAERWRHRRTGHQGCGLAMMLRWVEISGGRCNIEAIPRHGARVQAFWGIPAGAAAERRQESEVGAPHASTPV